MGDTNVAHFTKPVTPAVGRQASRGEIPLSAWAMNPADTVSTQGKAKGSREAKDFFRATAILGEIRYGDAVTQMTRFGAKR